MLKQLPAELAIFSPSLQSHVDEKLHAVEMEFQKYLSSEIKIISQMGSYIFQSGGKRIRPLLLILSSNIAGYQGDHDVLFGAIMEFVHTATLIHDDIIDKATQRRGQASLNSKWGNNLTVLMGDYLYTKAMSLALTRENMRILRLISDITLRMLEGEMISLERNGDIGISEQDHLNLVRRKTAYLFSGCSQIGAILGKVSPQKEAALQNFGLNLGMAFQLIDDLLDFTSSENVLGKPVGHDLEEGKLTLPLIYLLQREDGNQEIRAIRAALIDKNYDAIVRDRLLHYLKWTNAFADAESKAKFYASLAKNDLAIFDPSDARSAMLELLDFVIHRSW
ncbi:MAG TPA: polyprenyl synthetase family protein [Acidobacteriota bacterium]